MFVSQNCSREIFDPQIFEFPKTNSSKIVCQMCRFKQIIEVQTFFSLPTNKFVKKNLLIRINHKKYIWHQTRKDLFFLSHSMFDILPCMIFLNNSIILEVRLFPFFSCHAVNFLQLFLVWIGYVCYILIYPKEAVKFFCINLLPNTSFSFNFLQTCFNL